MLTVLYYLALAFGLLSLLFILVKYAKNDKNNVKDDTELFLN